MKNRNIIAVLIMAMCILSTLPFLVHASQPFMLDTPYTFNGEIQGLSFKDDFYAEPQEGFVEGTFRAFSGEIYLDPEMTIQIGIYDASNIRISSVGWVDNIDNYPTIGFSVTMTIMAYINGEYSMLNDVEAYIGMIQLPEGVITIAQLPDMQAYITMSQNVITITDYDPKGYLAVNGVLSNYTPQTYDFVKGTVNAYLGAGTAIISKLNDYVNNNTEIITTAIIIMASAVSLIVARLIIKSIRR